MKFVKKFKSFLEGATEVAPVKPKEKEKEKERTRPSKPGGIPSQDPRPGIAPDPTRAEKKKDKATAEEVAEKFINLMSENGEDLKKYVEPKW